VEFEGFVNYGTPITNTSTNLLGEPITTTITPNAILMPVFRTTRLKNQTITIQDGATIVLGGLMTSKKIKIEDKVPILGDIPYAGRLFRSEAEQSMNIAVIITINVELIDPSGRRWNRQ
jgi:general secretion pathway protein D